MALKDVVAGPRDEAAISNALRELEAHFRENLQTGQSFREQHCHTTTYLPSQLPDGVLFVDSVEDVRKAVQICAQHKVPIIAFGTGSSLEGQVNAPSGGISIDFSRMNKILSVNAEDLDVTVEPGVTREELNIYLRDTGLFFPIDPGANASLGGMVATRASGTNAVRYGTMKDNVVSLTAVMANGEEIRTASRAKKTSAGYDLTRLMVGSEGTLGLLTSITLRLHPIPEKITGAVCSFNSLRDACNAVIMTIQMGIPVARIELMNEVQVRACNAYSNLSFPETPMLLTEFHGSEDNALAQMNLFEEIARDCGATTFEGTADADERAKLWKARHNAYWATCALAPHLNSLATDVCVPISRLADLVEETQVDITENGLLATIVGHAGDGNFHSQILFDKNDPESVSKTEAFVARLNARALAMDGTCTGEHGIGQGKISFLPQEMGPALDVMRAIKMTLDPNNILNPGKIFFKL
jgi:D-lactate dehydrogenase (cytochrome)